MARSNGKVILLGEHAVVYGAPALAAGLEQGARATAQHATTTALVCGQERVLPGVGQVGQALDALLQELVAPPVEVHISLDVPSGCGLGASAAMGVVVARAIVELLDQGPEPGQEPMQRQRADRIDRAVTAWERVFHANPSGVDAAAAAHGGCIYFSRSGGTRPVHVAAPLGLAVAVAGPPASTREMVQAVARLRQRRPAFVDRTLGLIASLVEDGRRCIETGDKDTLGQLFDLNHMLLAGLMLSTPELEHAAHAARDSGALGAKLTGSGGGGCVVALVESDADRVLSAWRDRGLVCFHATVQATDTARGCAK